MGLFSENFVAVRAYEGPQVLLTWDLPTLSFTTLRLIRRKNAFPLSPTDGVEILNTTTLTKFSDTALEGLDVYYYTLFTEEPVGVFTFDKTVQAKAFALETGFFEKRMWFDMVTLPDRVSDRDTDQKILKKTTKSSGEQVNLKEDGIEEKGQLRRFLKLVSLSYDEIRQLCKGLALLPDVNRVDSDFLGRLAAIVGAEFNPDIPILRQREEIKRAVEVWKIKGTLPGLENVAESISGLDLEADEMGDNILIFNKLDSTFIDFNNVEEINSFGRPGDKTQRWLDFSETRQFSRDKIVFFVLLKPGDSFPVEILNKINRIMNTPGHLPANMSLLFIVLDEFDDQLNMSGVDESDDVITQWLVFNKLDRKFNDSDIVFADGQGKRV